VSEDEDYGETILPATGNMVKFHNRNKVYLEVSGGYGNGIYYQEVHLLMRSEDGDFAQGWFSLEGLRLALEKAGAVSE